MKICCFQLSPSVKKNKMLASDALFGVGWGGVACLKRCNITKNKAKPFSGDAVFLFCRYKMSSLLSKSSVCSCKTVSYGTGVCGDFSCFPDNVCPIPQRSVSFLVIFCIFLSAYVMAYFVTDKRVQHPSPLCVKVHFCFRIS